MVYCYRQCRGLSVRWSQQPCVVICLVRGADLHIAQLMPLPLTVSCSRKIQIGFTFLVPAYLGSPGKSAVKWVCVCVWSRCSLEQTGMGAKNMHIRRVRWINLYDWRRRLLLPLAASHAKQENLLLFMYCGLHVCLLVTTMSTIETTKPGHGQTDCYWSDHNCWTPHCFVYTVKGGNETRQHHLISKTCEFSDERRRVLDVVKQTVDVVDTTQASKHHVQTDAADRPDVGAVVRRQWVCHFGSCVVLTACTSDNYTATHNHWWHKQHTSNNTVACSGMVMARDSRLKGCEFDYQPFHFQVATVHKLFTHVPLSPSSIIWYQSRGDDALWLEGNRRSGKVSETSVVYPITGSQPREGRWAP